MLLLHCLFNLPHFRFPDSIKRLLIWVMEECGAHDVPSIRAYQEMNERIRSSSGVTTTLHKSSFGNEFYTNSIVEVIAKVSLLSLS